MTALIPPSLIKPSTKPNFEGEYWVNIRSLDIGWDFVFISCSNLEILQRQLSTDIYVKLFENVGFPSSLRSNKRDSAYLRSCVLNLSAAIDVAIHLGYISSSQSRLLLWYPACDLEMNLTLVHTLQRQPTINCLIGWEEFICNLTMSYARSG